MQELIDLVYVEGDLVQTCVRMFILVISVECVFGFANLIKGIGRSTKC